MVSPPNPAAQPDDDVPSPTLRRERLLLLLAAGVVLTGSVTLTIADPLFGPLHLALAVVVFAAAFAAAHALLNRSLPHRDPLLLPTAALLTGLGLLLIGRLAINFFLRQIAWLLVATAALVAVARLGRDLRWLRRFRYTWLLGGLALLAATLVFGVNPSGFGPRLWLGAGGVYVQPAEILKLLMIAYLASYLAERQQLLLSPGRKLWRWQLPPLATAGPLLAMFGLAMVLLTWQQDLGAAMLFFFTFLAMLYLATGRRGYVAVGLELLVAVGLVGYLFSSKVALRIDGWINPWPEAADRAFQIVQSLLALGAGGLFGRGLGLGHPTFIPAVHTDFCLAAAAEELGLAGVLAIVALYGTLLLRGFRAAARARHPFERLLAAGLTTGLVVQAWVIMAGNARLAPIAGVTLPFVSYGGSSILTSFIALALLLRISNLQSGGASIQVNKDTSTQGARQTNQLTNHPTNKPTTNLPIYQSTSLPTTPLALTLAAALVLLALFCGYWSFVRAGDLRAREDNPRRVLYEQTIVRGRLLDRQGAVLADVEVAGDGTVARRYPLPEAAPAVGYASLRHGTGGVEAAFDAELRGEAGRSAWQAAWDDLLHRPPQGRDVRLALDAALQARARQALEDRAGSVVLLDARSGDVLAMASAPTFDPQQLDETWDALREDPAAPLVNRATHGLYQPGAALQTVVLAEALMEELADLAAPAIKATTPISVDGILLACSEPGSRPRTLAQAYGDGCPAPFATLGEQLGAGRLEAAIERWQLTVTPPPLEIATEADDWYADGLTTTTAVRSEAVGQGDLTVTPLQMALVAATLANEGTMPAPRLALAVEGIGGGWEEQASAGEPRRIVSAELASQLFAAWTRYGEHVAGLLATAVAGEEAPPHAWFLGAAPANGPRYVIAVLVEHAEDAQLAAEIGRALLETVVQRD